MRMPIDKISHESHITEERQRHRLKNDYRNAWMETHINAKYRTATYVNQIQSETSIEITEKIVEKIKSLMLCYFKS